MYLPGYRNQPKIVWPVGRERFHEHRSPKDIVGGILPHFLCTAPMLHCDLLTFSSKSSTPLGKVVQKFRGGENSSILSNRVVTVRRNTARYRTGRPCGVSSDSCRNRIELECAGLRPYLSLTNRALPIRSTAGHNALHTLDSGWLSTVSVDRQWVLSYHQAGNLRRKITENASRLATCMS